MHESDLNQDSLGVIYLALFGTFAKVGAMNYQCSFLFKKKKQGITSGAGISR